MGKVRIAESGEQRAESKIQDKAFFVVADGCVLTADDWSIEDKVNEHS